MKNKIWVLIMMAGIIIGIIACDDPKAQPVYCPDTDNNGNGHLGIGEDCSKDTGDCTGLQNYNTSTGEDAFPVPIYRVGALSGFQNAPATPEATASHIMATYAIQDDADKKKIKDGVPDKGVKLTFVHICKDAIGPTPYPFEWNKSILVLQADILSTLGSVLRTIASGNLPTNPSIAQLQPAGNIRMVKGKKSTERFPVIAGGADKDPKVNTVAQNFKLNRQVIARNNRNVKSLLRQA